MTAIEKDPARFDFREIHPQVFLGTTSDRYAGWLGQIYTPEAYEGRITRRTKVLGGASYLDEVLPVDSVREYFTHFPVLEIDFTFYRPLLTATGQPTPNHHVLQTYARHLKENDKIALKVPQIVFARKIRRGKTFVPNEDYLNADLFLDGFYRPVQEILGRNIRAFLFEQEYQRQAEQKIPEVFAAELDDFFRRIPEDPRYHVELRTAKYLVDPVFELLKSRGVGLVLSHWTWLPSLRAQFRKSYGADFNPDRDVVIRLLTPRGMTYEKTYALAHPFNRIVEGMFGESSLEETVEVIQGLVRRGSRVWLFINNRAGGNAPLMAERIVKALRESFG